MNIRAKEKFDFNNLFIFDMANNHMGSVEHGLKIINAMADVVDRNGIKAAVKFQFRDVESFVHPDHKENSDNKHIPKFIATYLKKEQYKILTDEIRRRGLYSMCTPFDEVSVGKIEELDIDIVKIASCSAMDWPLLERVSETGKPVICSTGGLNLGEVDRIVSFFQHRGVHFALEHCVAIYPTPTENFHLNQIEIMRRRYPGITVGFSTHEDPNDTSIIQLAYAKGARMFEKHVGVETDEIKLNKYSGNPVQVAEWVKAFKDAVAICGPFKQRTISDAEQADLKALKRGVFAVKEIKTGEAIKRENVFFAMPLYPGQLTSGEFKEGQIADRDYVINQPISEKVKQEGFIPTETIYSSIHAVKGMLNNARIPIGHDFKVELSHHFGLDRFHEVGCVIIDIIHHEEYAKKLIIQLPGQYNPTHYHKKKDETFQILYGSLEVEIEGRKKFLVPGDVLWVPRGVWHDFGTETGVIFEEISTRNFSNDSFYIDKSISRIPRDTRKTYLVNWGRHQFTE